MGPLVSPSRRLFIEAARLVPLSYLRTELSIFPEWNAPLRTVLASGPDAHTIHAMDTFHLWVEGMEVLQDILPEPADGDLETILKKTGLSSGKHQVNLLRTALAWKGLHRLAIPTLRAIASAPVAFLPYLQLPLQYWFRQIKIFQ